jgi:hypothetical protein
MCLDECEKECQILENGEQSTNARMWDVVEVMFDVELPMEMRRDDPDTLLPPRH